MPIRFYKDSQPEGIDVNPGSRGATGDVEVVPSDNVHPTQTKMSRRNSPDVEMVFPHYHTDFYARLLAAESERTGLHVYWDTVKWLYELVSICLYICLPVFLTYYCLFMCLKKYTLLSRKCLCRYSLILKLREKKLQGMYLLHFIIRVHHIVNKVDTV